MRSFATASQHVICVYSDNRLLVLSALGYDSALVCVSSVDQLGIIVVYMCGFGIFVCMSWFSVCSCVGGYVNFVYAA